MLMYLFNKYFRELRSHMLLGMDQKKKKIIIETIPLGYKGFVLHTAMVLCIFCTHDATLF